MITNERQYKITNSQYNKLLKAKNEIEALYFKNKKDQLIKIQLDALKSECEVLEDQIHEYELLKSGETSKFTVNTFSDLPLILIKARIAKGLAQGEFAKLLALKEQQIQRYEADLYSTVSFKKLTEIAEVLGLKIGEIAELQKDISNKDLQWKEFPIKEMYKRNWFIDFKESLDSALANGEYLINEFLNSVYAQPVKAFNKMHTSINSTLDPYSLYAWQCRIAWLALKEDIENKYSKENITTEWIKELVSLSALDDGIKKVKSYLNSSGIHFIIESHLPHTSLDGAVLLLSNNKSPVIGMTLRYNRLDNFWFVLLHEIAHLYLHIPKLKTDCYLDSDIESNLGDEDIEIEADRFANDMLIPDDIWETSIVRYIHSEENIIDFAKQLKISPAIVAGRIRRETNNYTIYNNLIGQGDVKKKFPEVIFS